MDKDNINLPSSLHKYSKLESKMWYHNGKEFISDVAEYDSFVYLITRVSNNEDLPKYYIGKKTFWFKSRKKVKGKKNREIIKKESDWVEYFGSSDWLSEVINIEGKENFRREIIHLCKSRGESFVLEAKEQMQNNVLSKHYNNGTKVFYNKQILGKYKKEYFSKAELQELQSSKNTMNATGEVCITNGIESKRIKTDSDLPDGWRYGNHYRANYSWINNGKDEMVVPRLDVNSLEYRDWNLGRLYSPSKNKKCVTKLDTVKYVTPEDVEIYIENGWELGNKTIKTHAARNKIYVCHDASKSQKLVDRDKTAEFLKENEDWRIGQFIRGNFGTENKVFAVDMLTGKKIQVTKEEYKDNNNLTSVKTKKVKVKKKNRIVFSGFLPQFFEQFDLPEAPFRKAIRNKEPKIVIQKGKNKFLTEEQWSIIEI